MYHVPVCLFSVYRKHAIHYYNRTLVGDGIDTSFCNPYERRVHKINYTTPLTNINKKSSQTLKWFARVCTLSYTCERLINFFIIVVQVQ